MNHLKIEPFKVNSHKIEVPKLAKEIGLIHPFSIGVFGCSGSGKTVLTCQLIYKDNLYRKYFDKIYIFSPTGAVDDTLQYLKIKDEFIITDNMIEKLDELIEQQTNEVEDKGLLDADKILIIFDDLTSQKKLMNSPQFMKCSIQNRHLNISSIFICHKYNSLLRTVRLNVNHLMIFPCSLSEQKIIIDEHTTPNLTLKQMSEIIKYAFKKSSDNPKPFLWINLKTDFDKRFKKNLDENISSGEIPDCENIDEIKKVLCSNVSNEKDLINRLKNLKK